MVRETEQACSRDQSPLCVLLSLLVPADLCLPAASSKWSLLPVTSARPWTFPSPLPCLCHSVYQLSSAPTAPHAEPPQRSYSLFPAWKSFLSRAQRVEIGPKRRSHWALRLLQVKEEERVSFHCKRGKTRLKHCLVGRQCREVVRTWALEPDCLVTSPGSAILLYSLQQVYITTPCLSFLICKMGILNCEY